MGKRKEITVEDALEPAVPYLTAALGLPVAKCYMMLAEGEPPSYKIKIGKYILVKPSEVQAWLATQRHQGKKV